MTARANLAGAIARLAREALVEEPRVWPRLGLVGPHDTGAHVDMSIHHFEASAVALEPYFAALVELGARPGPTSATKVEAARALGRAAEEQMLRSTGGRNTHKGAIFLLGVLVLGWASQPHGRPSVSSILASGSRAFAPSLRRELASLDPRESYGAWAFHRHGSRGIRGLVLDDFAVLRTVWRASSTIASTRLALGNARLLAAALSDDTNLIKRANLGPRERVRGELYGLWRRGGVLDPRNRRELERLELWLERRRWSAAASGDLTGAVLLLRKLCHEGHATA